MKTYGVQGADGSWLRWITIDSARNDGEPDTGWISGPTVVIQAWQRSEREAKAMSMLIPDSKEKHPLRVRPVPREIE